VGRPSQNLVFIQDDDSDSETTGRAVKPQEGRKRGRRKGQFRGPRSPNSEVDEMGVKDSYVPNSNSSRQKVTAKAKNPVTKKFPKALAVAAELLSAVGSEEVIEELTADNIFDEDNLIHLRTSCIAKARLLRIKASANRDAADGGSAEPVREDCFIFRASSKEVMLLAPGEQFPHALCLQA
jgi:hypothetical protein